MKRQTHQCTKIIPCSIVRIFLGQVTTPTPLEVYPALAFDQLFKDKSQAGDESVLDAVLQDAKGLRKELVVLISKSLMST